MERINDVATRAVWHNRTLRKVVLLLSLGAIGQPRCWAQLQHDGGYVQTHREDRAEVSQLAAPQAEPPPNARPSLSPDNDFFYYPTFRQVTSSISRSAYYAGGPASPVVFSGTATNTSGSFAAVLPWNRSDFQGYDELSPRAWNASFFSPRKCSLRLISLSERPLASLGPAALLIVHLPANARLSVEGKWIPLQGQTSYFRSPPLSLGKKYDYTVRAAWLEDGHWVSLSREVTVEAGQCQAIYLQRSSE